MTDPAAEQIYQQATQLPPEDQLQFLEDACCGKPLLHAELSALLREGGDISTTLALGARSFLASAPATSSAGRLIERCLGVWTIKRFLARGGFGEVYVGERSGDYQQKVAIKILRTGEDTDDTLLERFRRERQALADLRHEYIATLLDGGTTEDGSIIWCSST